MAEISQTRRRFLRTLIVAVPGAWFLHRFFSMSVPAQKLLATVADKDLPQRGALVFRQQRFALLREGGEVYALSLVCTHLGCTLNVTENQLSCPCHGSIFERSGTVSRGPADRPLPRLRLQRQQDSWLVYG